MSVEMGFVPVDSDITSEMFSNAIHTLFGDGITDYGKQFSIRVGGFTATLDSGYIISAGRWAWLEEDETALLDIQLPSLNKDRTDAIVCHVDYAERKASLQVLFDVEEAKIRNDPSLIRNSDQYNCIMYFINVKRGATSISSADIKDVRSDSKLCGYIKPLKNLIGDVVTVHKYFTDTIVKNFANLNAVKDKYKSELDNATGSMKSTINSALDELDKKVSQYGSVIQVGDLMTSLQPPQPDGEWFLCNGENVPVEYPELSNLVGKTIPKIPKIADLLDTYIYAGKPSEVVDGYLCDENDNPILFGGTAIIVGKIPVGHIETYLSDQENGAILFGGDVILLS